MFKNLYYIAILTTIVVVSWIAFEVYNSNVTSTITPDQSIVITPIPASFDQETIIAIKSKKVINADLSQNKATESATPQVSQPTPTRTASPAASITPVISPLPGL